MIFCLAGLFAAQGCSYKEMASLSDWAIAGKIAMGDIRTGEQTIFDYLIQPLTRAKEALVQAMHSTCRSSLVLRRGHCSRR